MTGGVIWLAAALLLVVARPHTTHIAWMAVIIAGAGGLGAVFAHTEGAAFSIAAAALCLATIAMGQGADLGAAAAYAGATGMCLLAVETEQLVYSTMALLAASAVVSFRWMAVSPGRQTMAGVRAICVGAAILAAIAPLLPVLPTTTGVLPALVIGMSLAALVPLAGFFPVGGWAVGAARNLGQLDVAGWVLVIVPGVLVVMFRIVATLPYALALNATHLMLALALLAASWCSVRAFALQGRHRYFRILFADVALAVAALASGSWSAIPAAELLLALHLVTYVFLSGDAGGRRIWWFAVSCLPPAPGFWARLLVVQACALTNATSAILSVTVVSLISIAAMAEASRSRPAPRVVWIRKAIALAAGICAVFLAIAPAEIVHATFGLR